MIEKTSATFSLMALAGFGYYALSGRGLTVAVVLAIIALFLVIIGLVSCARFLDETAQELVAAKSNANEPEVIRMRTF